MNLFDNRYKKEDLIGRGAFSEVCRATDAYTNAVMALKIYTSSSQIDDDGLEMLKHEFALMIDADHQNLLRPLHFGVSAEGWLPYLTLPYCKGGNINQTWCSFSPTSGSNDGSVTVSVGENSSTVERMATITVKSEAGDQTVKVTQSGVSPTLTLNIDNMEFEAGSGSKIFSIKSNTAWAVSSNGNWCSVSPTSGSNEGSVTVSVDENTSTSSRTATITVESVTIKRTLAVTQNGVTPTPTPTPASQDRSFTVGGVTFKMIRVEGGTFTMGGTSEQGNDAWEDESPTHRVTLSTYYVGETEVTQELWQAVMGSNPSYYSGGQRPVERVSWYDCQDFVNKLNALTDCNFHLPTEAQWEFAACGGNKSLGYKYAGSNVIDNVAWYYGNSADKTHDVAQKSPNELGLYDMSGNVWEWCQDWYGAYSSSSQVNPTGPSSGVNRVYRGGSLTLRAEGCRVSYRVDIQPSSTYTNLGFRLAL